MVCSAERIDDAMTTKSTQDGSSTLPKERSTIGDVEHGSGARDSASSATYVFKLRSLLCDAEKKKPLPFSLEYLDSNSSSYKQLAKEICNQVKEVIELGDSPLRVVSPCFDIHFLRMSDSGLDETEVKLSIQVVAPNPTDFHSIFKTNYERSPKKHLLLDTRNIEALCAIYLSVR
ncbi:unnamed protein product [Heterobilharzia americana]|nr:unnamed protein product [Heterobilharzia americana]